MTTWFELKKEVLNDPTLKDTPMTKRLQIAGERWRKITGKPKAPKKTRKNKKVKEMVAGKASKSGKSNSNTLSCPGCKCNLNITLTAQ
jgi:hypothetical protein